MGLHIMNSRVSGVWLGEDREDREGMGGRGGEVMC